MSLENAAMLYTKASELRKDGPYPHAQAVQLVLEAFLEVKKVLGQNDEKNGGKAKAMQIRCYYLNALIAFDIEQDYGTKDFDNIIIDLKRCLDENGEPPLIPSVHTCTYYMLAKIAYLQSNKIAFLDNYKRAIYSARIYLSEIDVPNLAPALHQQYLNMKEESADDKDEETLKRHTPAFRL